MLMMLDRISLKRKMLLLALLFLGTLAAPTTFFLKVEKASLDVVELELKGVESAYGMNNVLKFMQQHRGMSAGFLSGNTLAKNALLEKSQEVTKALQTWENKLNTWQANELISQVAALRQAWEPLANDVHQQKIDTASSSRQHSELIAQVLELKNTLTRLSSMDYDPAAETYHMIIAALHELPALTEALGQSRALVNVALVQGNISLNNRLRLSGLLKLAAERQAAVEYQLLQSSLVDADIGSQYRAAQALRINVNAFINRIEQELLQPDLPIGDPAATWSEITALIDSQFALQNDTLALLEAKLHQRKADIRSNLNTTLFLLATLILLSVVIGVVIIRGVIRSLNLVVQSTEQIIAGDYLLTVDGQRTDEFGAVNRAMLNMRDRLKEAAEQEKIVQQNNEKVAREKLAQAERDAVRAEELLQIKQALDVTSTNIMIANADRKIVYMNNIMKQFLHETESSLRASLPNFSAANVIGGSMDIFHKNPHHQSSLLSKLESAHIANIVVCKMHFRLTANPIFNENRQRIGTVLEWLDRTVEVAAENEIGQVVEAAAKGDFSARIDIGSKKDFFLKLAEGLNTLLNTTESGLNDINSVLNAIAQGDLTERVTADYQGSFEELKDGCNLTAENLSQMLSEIREAVDTINTVSTEISQGNTDLFSRTEQQASSLEETASSMEELTSTVRQNADNARQANTLAAKASDVAVEGGSLIEQVVKTMASINESAQKISDIIGVIDGIAFQTNILALNAAVEAARAGEQGRGFAVVASEVRTLAQRSANAAKDIKALISDSVNKINNGNELVGKSGNTMKEIVTSIKRVNDIMAEIAAASSEQSAGLDEVGKAVTQMDEMTQQNAALVEEAAAAAESLLSQSEQLAANVARFTLDDEPVRPVRKALAAPKKQLRTAVANPAVKAKAKPATRLLKPTKSDEDEWESF